MRLLKSVVNTWLLVIESKDVESNDVESFSFPPSALVVFMLSAFLFVFGNCFKPGIMIGLEIFTST